jgi:hypothetical protein
MTYAMVIPIPTDPNVEGLHRGFTMDHITQEDAIVLGVVFLIEFIKT